MSRDLQPYIKRPTYTRPVTYQPKTTLEAISEESERRRLSQYRPVEYTPPTLSYKYVGPGNTIRTRSDVIKYLDEMPPPPKPLPEGPIIGYRYVGPGNRVITTEHYHSKYENVQERTSRDLIRARNMAALSRARSLQPPADKYAGKKLYDYRPGVDNVNEIMLRDLNRRYSQIYQGLGLEEQPAPTGGQLAQDYYGGYGGGYGPSYSSGGGYGGGYTDASRGAGGRGYPTFVNPVDWLYQLVSWTI